MARFLEAEFIPEHNLTRFIEKADDADIYSTVCPYTLSMIEKYNSFNSWCENELGISFRDQHGVCISDMQFFYESAQHQLALNKAV